MASIGVAAAVVAGLVVFPARAHASCNLIPVAKKQYPSVLGGVTEPITLDGRTVELSVTSCDASPGFEPVASDNAVELRFEPPGPGADTVVVVDTLTQIVSDCTLPGGRCSTLIFETPDTTAELPPYGLAGPARITVRDTATAVVAEIAQLYLPTLSCDRSPETVFQQFTVLPTPNSFADATNGGITELLATVDGGGSLLLPFDYWGGGSNSVLAETPGAPVAIFLRGSAEIPAANASDTRTIREVISQQDSPSEFIRSFTLNGRPLPPLLRMTDTGELLGSADAVESVLRIARNDGKGGDDLYDLSDRLFSGRGPIVINTFTTERKSPIPLKSIRASGNTIAFAREESSEGVNLNGDTDTDDHVMEIVNAETGDSFGTQSAVVETPVLQGQFYDIESADSISEPAAVSGGDIVAFLEYESDQDEVDRNADGDVNDSFLRVYRRDGTNLTAANPNIEAAAISLVDGRPLAVSGRRVFFRTPNPFVQRSFTGVTPVDVAVSPDGQHLYVVSDVGDVLLYLRDQTTGRVTFVDFDNPGDGTGTSVTVSPDGENVYFTKINGVHVYSRDDVTGELTFLETHTDGMFGESGLGGAEDQVVSLDGENVYVSASSGNVVVYTRNLATGALTFLEAEPVSYAGGAHLVVSPDGKHVYAGLDRLDRSAVDGALTLSGDGLLTGNQIAIAPDGKTVYEDDPPFLTAHVRDANTGALSLSSTSCDGFTQFFAYVGCSGLSPGAGFSDGIGNPPVTRQNEGIQISADGSRLYTRGFNSTVDALFVNAYTRSPGNGRPTYAGSFLDGTAGVQGLQNSGGIALSPDGKFLYAASDVVDAIVVFNNDLKLAVFDTETQTLLAHQPHATTVSVAGERAIMLSNEGFSGDDLNNDGDMFDEVAQIYDASGSIDVVYPLISANRLAISDQIAAFTVPESSEANTDLNLDGDKDDDDIVVVDLANGGQLVDLELSAQRIAVSGDKVVLASQETFDLSDDENGDGDFDDLILTWINPRTFDGDIAPLPIRSFSVNGPIVAFLALEYDNFPLNTDFNGDLDDIDAVMHFWRIDTGEVFNTGQAAEWCKLPGMCPPLTPFKIDVANETVSFLQDQAYQGTSLDTEEIVLQVFSMRSGTGQILSQLKSDLGGSLAEEKLPAFPQPFLKGDIVFRPVRENNPDLNQDVNDDGVINSAIVMVVQGDSDGDGMIDEFDGCVDLSNPDGLDLDGDGLGDSACDPDPSVCPPAPLVGCRAPAAEKASIDIKNDSDDAKDSVKWKWGKGDATTLADIGNPLTGQPHYSLCVYDDSADPQPLLASAAVAQAVCGEKSCWKAQGTKGYGYKDKSGHTSGTQQLKMTSGAAGKAKVGYKGKGANLGLVPLSPTLPLTVQLIVNEGDRQDCWSASYGTSDIADPDRFKAKSD